MKPYIVLNTRLKTAAKNEFEKDFFQPMNNTVFGNTMRNIRIHKDMKLLTSREKYTKDVMKPNFKDGYPFSKELFAVGVGKTKIKMIKPVYLGLVALDLSDTLIMTFTMTTCSPSMEVR